ncbi:amino acid transporter [Thozetella sp. PMI_491]|nr:amino acid transporter [Thozetella sp. PMI_491]
MTNNERPETNGDSAKGELGPASTGGSFAVGAFDERVFSTLSVIGIGYSVTNSAMAILASLSTAIGSGGPVSLVWGQIGIFLIAICIAVTLGEFSSAMPNAAGQFYWVARLAPECMKRPLAFNIGLLAWASAMCITASGTLILPQMILGMYSLRDPNFVYQPWMGFVGFQITNIVIFFFNTVERFLPYFSRASMAWSVASLVIIFVAVLAASPMKQPASFVFTDFVNFSGWNDALAVLTGLVGVNWGYSCLDACCHMAEEIPQPERNIPKALLATVFVGFATAFPLTLAILFSMQDLNEAISTSTMVPSLEIFLQCFSGNQAAAVGLQSLIVVVFVGSIFGAQTWQSRLCWTFARQGGLPLSQHFGSIAPHPFMVPMWSHVLSCVGVALLGFVYLGSTTAFGSFVSGGLLFQNLTYSTCSVCLFVAGRSKFAHGPFWFPKLGPICHAVTVLWTLYSIVIYSFPPTNPTTPATMNYVSVVLVGVILLINIAWVVYGRKTFVSF